MDMPLKNISLKPFKNTWILTIIVLVFVNLGLFVYNKYQKTENQKVNSNLRINTANSVLQIVDELKVLTLVDLNERIVEFKNILSLEEPKLIVFLSPSDCPSCLREIELWNRIRLELDTPVIGIIPDYNIEGIKMFALNENIKFDLWIDLEQQLMSKIDFSETPIKLLLDKDNNILSITTTFRYAELESQFFDVIKLLVNQG